MDRYLCPCGVTIMVTDEIRHPKSIDILGYCDSCKKLVKIHISYRLPNIDTK